MLDAGFSEKPDQHKCGHVIKLDNGNYAIQPNNRVKVFDPAFRTHHEGWLIDRLINSHVWSVEANETWLTEDSDAYHYEISETGAVT